MEFEEFATHHAADLLRFARALTGERGLAEDLVQETLLKLYQRRGQLEGLSDPDAYARRIVVNGYVSWGRRWFRVRPTAWIDDEVEPDHAEGHSDRDEMRSLLYRLPRRQRAVLVLRYYAGLTDEEIAQELGCSPGTVRSHASRGLAALRVEHHSNRPHAEEIRR